ncbi:hypothetical protein IWW38_003798, partial [Coemansia aciculifera]
MNGDSGSNEQQRSALEVYREWLNESSASSNNSSGSGDEMTPPHKEEDDVVIISHPQGRRFSSTPPDSKSPGSSVPKPFTPSQPAVLEYAQQQLHELKRTSPPPPPPPAVKKKKVEEGEDGGMRSSAPPPSSSSPSSRREQGVKSPSSRLVNTPRKLMNQMSFRSMLSASPAPQQQPAKSEKRQQNPLSPLSPKAINGGGKERLGMGALFGDASVARPTTAPTHSNAIHQHAD